MTAWLCGPMLLQNTWFLEQLAHFDRTATGKWQKQPDFAEPPLSGDFARRCERAINRPDIC